ncbi:MAG TPA: rRNA maturation RNase YbeY [Longimicrobiaceae bacterium]|nr:rRNA maturation RNase YbeY [Longimicrobiaceae bacterium]
MPYDVEVSAGDGITPPVALAEVAAAVRAVLAGEAVPEAEISVALLGDEAIAKLNERYLSHEGPTDVLSFPLHADGAPPLGDIYVGVDQARRQADEIGVPVREEVLRLAVHGTLHVLGYDHPEGAGREDCEMYRRQEELLGSVLSR